MTDDHADQDSHDSIDDDQDDGGLASPFGLSENTSSMGSESQLLGAFDPDTVDDDQDGGGLASLVNQSLNSAPEHPRPSHRDVPLSVAWPGFLVGMSIVVSVVGVLFDDSETLSDVSMAGALAFLFLALLFLVFLPWLGLALLAYSRRLEYGRRQTTMKFVGIAALVVAAIPWIPTAIVVIVSPFWSP